MKKIVHIIVATVMALCATVAHAAYPERAARIIVPFPPGGPTDVQARLIAQRLSDRLGETFIVENRPGAGGNIGTRAAAQSPGDGYTLLFMTPAQVINMKFYSTPGYDLKTDFAPIGLVSTAPALLLAHPSLGATSLADVIRLAKEKPGEIAFASSGAGLSTHLMMESFMKHTDIQMIHVPYRGSAPALSGLIAGDTSLLMDSVVSGLPHVQSGALRAIAVSSAERSPVAPDIPTMRESGLTDFAAITWYGIMAPIKTPNDIVLQLAAEIDKILQEPDIRKRFLEMGTEPAKVDPDAFAKFLDAEAERWLEVVQSSGARMEE